MSSNKIKNDVIMTGIKSEMVLCDTIIQTIFNEFGFDCVRTSVTGKKHGSFSFHPLGLAIDYRTKHIPGNDLKEQIADKIKDSLPCCDVILEHLDKDQEHLHVEFDPKNDHTFQEKKEKYKKGEVYGW